MKEKVVPLGVAAKMMMMMMMMMKEKKKKKNSSSSGSSKQQQRMNVLEVVDTIKGGRIFHLSCAQLQRFF